MSKTKNESQEDPAASRARQRLRQEQRKRLKRLIDHLTKIEVETPEAFRLSSWSHGDTKLLYKVWKEETKAGKPLSCGASACVVGHMTVIFPEDFYWHFPLTGGWSSTPSVMLRGRYYFNASQLASYFGGTRWQWKDIIYPTNYPLGASYRTADNQVRLSAVLDRLRALKADTDKNK